MSDTRYVPVNTGEDPIDEQLNLYKWEDPPTTFGGLQDLNQQTENYIAQSHFRLTATELQSLNRGLQKLEEQTQSDTLDIAIRIEAEKAKINITQLVTQSLENESERLTLPKTIPTSIKELHQVNDHLLTLCSSSNRLLTETETQELNTFLEMLDKIKNESLSPAVNLCKQTIIDLLEEQNEIIESASLRKSFKKKLKFVLVMLCGVILAALEGFDGGQSLFSIISVITSPGLLFCGIFFALVDGFNFVATYLEQFKKAFGTTTLSESKALTSLFHKKLELIQELFTYLPLPGRENDHLFKNNPPLASAYLNIIQTIIHDQTNTAARIENASLGITNLRATVKKYFKTGITWLTGISYTGFGLFAGQGFLALLGFAAFATTPPGWAICGLFATLALLSFIYTQRENITSFVDVLFGGPAKLHKEHAVFKKESQKVSHAIEHAKKSIQTEKERDVLRIVAKPTQEPKKNMDDLCVKYHYGQLFIPTKNKKIVVQDDFSVRYRRK